MKSAREQAEEDFDEFGMRGIWLDRLSFGRAGFPLAFIFGIASGILLATDSEELELFAAASGLLAFYLFGMRLWAIKNLSQQFDADSRMRQSA